MIVSPTFKFLKKVFGNLSRYFFVLIQSLWNWKDLAYTCPEELNSLQDLSEETELYEAGHINLNQWIRVICLLLMATCYYTLYLYWNITKDIYPFTNLTLFITTISVAYSFWAAMSPSYFGKLALTNKEIIKIDKKKLNKIEQE